MMMLGLIGVIATFCWLIFKLTVHALPAFVGISAGLFAHQTGAGPIVAILIALLVGGAVLGFGQALFAHFRSRTAQTALTALFVLPAVYAAYHAAHEIAGMGSISDAWRVVLAAASAVIVGVVAWMRLSDLARVQGGTELNSRLA